MSRHLFGQLRRAVHQFNGKSVSSVRLASTSPIVRNVQQSEASDKNVVKSAHGDCTIHGMTLVQRVLQTATLWPDKVAIECGLTGRKYTYGAMTHMIRRFGSALTRMGFVKGDVFGIVLPNLPEYPIAMLGAAGAGMPVTLINPIYTIDEMARLILNTGAKAIIGIPQMDEQLKAVAKKCPQIKRIIILGPPQEGVVSFQEMLADPGDLFQETLPIDVENDVFLLPHSSGTSGLPKNVMLTNYTVGTNIMQTLHPSASRNLWATCGEQDVYICLIPFFHTFGTTVLMLTGFELGAKLVTLPKLELATYFKAVNDHKPTVLHLVPALVPILIKQRQAIKDESLERLRTLVTAAAPLGTHAAELLLKTMYRPGLSLQDGYGMTEASPAVLLSPLDNVKLGSCGGPISRTIAKIVSLDSGEALGPHEKGELHIKGPQIMKGYVNDEKSTSETISDDGWLRTGDIGYYDNDGHFFIVDRVKELIKVKGNQVAPAELEHILRQHPAVADCAVIGIPDELAGELPRAYVVKRRDVDVTEADIASFIDEKVAPYKRIKGGVEFSSAILRSSMGKILRREILAHYLKSKQQ